MLMLLCPFNNPMRQQGAAEALQYDAVVLAVGNYAQPNLPTSVAGMRECPALQMHCHNFRSPRQFAGQTVLVVGASFSGNVTPWRPHSPPECQKATDPDSCSYCMHCRQFVEHSIQYDACVIHRVC